MSGFDVAHLDIVEKGDAPQPLDLGKGDDGAIARVYVLSSQSKTMRRWDRAQTVNAAKRGRSMSPEEIVDANEARGIARTARLLMAKPWEHIDKDGAPLAFTKENAQWLVEHTPVGQLVAIFAAQETNFFSSAAPRLSATLSGTSASADDPDAQD